MSGQLQRLVLTFKPEGIEIRTLYRHNNGPNPGTKARTKQVTELTRAGLRDALETLEGGAAELTHMIERRARKGEVDRDENEALWKASAREYNDRRQEEHRAAWCEYHQGQAARHRAVLEALVARHEDEAAKLMEADQPKGAA